MKVNTFNFALKWALVIFGIDLLWTTIPFLTSISGGASKPFIFVMLNILGMVAKFVVFTVAVVQYGRATNNKLPASEMWLFGGLMYVLVTGFSFASSALLKFLALTGEDTAQQSHNIDNILSIGFSLLIGMVALVSAMLLAGRWRTFEKAGKPGWYCLIPIYNLVVIAEIGKKPIWWVIMLFIPLVGLVFYIMLLHAMVKSFGKDEGWTVGLLFIPFVFYPMLAWGDAKYQYGEFESNDELGVEDHLVE